MIGYIRTNWGKFGHTQGSFGHKIESWEGTFGHQMTIALTLQMPIRIL